MTQSSTQFGTPDAQRHVLAPLGRLGRTLKRRAVVQGFCRTLAVLLGVATVHFGLDRLLLLGVGPRAALLILVVGIAAYQIWTAVLRSMLMPIGATDVAALVERRFPSLDDRLVSAVSFLTGPPPRPESDSPELVGAVVAEAADRMSTLKTREILHPTRHLRQLAVGLAALVIAFASTLAMPDTLATYLARNFGLQDLPWPSRIVLTLEGFRDGKLRWPTGDNLMLVARADNEIPRGLRAEFDLAGTTGPLRDMIQHGENRFVFDYGPLQQSMRVRFSIWRFGVDEKTQWYDIEAVERPSVKQAFIGIAPPSYTGLPRFELATGQTSADILRGSRVWIVATLGKAVTQATLRTADKIVSPATLDPDGRIHAEFVPQSSGAYFFELTDAEGLTDLNPVTYSFVLQNDPPPKVRLILPGAGDMLTPEAILQIDVECEDNLALKEVSLLHRVERQAAAATSQPAMTRQPLPGLEPRQTRFSRVDSLLVSTLGAKPGDQLTLQLQARDYQTSAESEAAIEKMPAAERSKVPANPGLGESPAYRFRIVTPEELLAELSRREMEWRREFEQVIKSQEQIEKRLQDLSQPSASAPTSTELVARIGPEERAQRQQIGRMRTIARQFEQILSELEVNQLASSPVRRRLDGGVIRPLRRLIESDVPAAAEGIQRLQAAFTADQADQVQQEQRRLVQSMYGILANMLKWEGYGEAVAALRDIIRLQGNLNRETQERLQREIERMFGEPPASQPKD
jgi:hypothetical protein